MAQHALSANESRFTLNDFTRLLPSKEKVYSFGLKTAAVMGLGLVAVFGAKQAYETATADNGVEYTYSSTSDQTRAVATSEINNALGQTAANTIGNYAGIGLGTAATVGTGLALCAPFLRRRARQEEVGTPSQVLNGLYMYETTPRINPNVQLELAILDWGNESLGVAQEPELLTVPAQVTY